MRRKPPPLLEEEGSDEPLINLTPLIDVVFVVLITFILIAPMLSIDRVELAPSGASSKRESATSKSDSISLAVHADNSIWLQGRRVTLPELAALLKDEKKRHPKATPQLAQDAKAAFGTYQGVKNALEAAGFEELEVLLQPG